MSPNCLCLDPTCQRTFCPLIGYVTQILCFDPKHQRTFVPWSDWSRQHFVLWSETSQNVSCLDPKCQRSFCPLIGYISQSVFVPWSDTSRQHLEMSGIFMLWSKTSKNFLYLDLIRHRTFGALTQNVTELFVPLSEMSKTFFRPDPIWHRTFCGNKSTLWATDTVCGFSVFIFIHCYFDPAAEVSAVIYLQYTTPWFWPI